MANLTLAVDDARYVEARSRRLEALSRFEAVAASCHSSSAEAWTRESLHDPLDARLR